MLFLAATLMFVTTGPLPEVKTFSQRKSLNFFSLG